MYLLKYKSFKYISIAILLLLLIFSILPFLWMLITSFKSSIEIYTNPPTWIPKYPTLNNFIYILQRGNFAVYFRNSALVALATTIITLIVSSCAGYAFSRFRFRGWKFLFLAFLITQMFPSVLLIIPLFQVVKTMRLMDTLYALVLSYITFNLPLCVWLLKGFFDQVPRELEEAAMIDGCSHVSALVRVILPVSLPGIIATGIFAFIGAWDELVFAMTFTSSDSSRTLSVGLNRFITSYEIQWNHLAAGSVITTIPVVIMFLFVQRFLVKGVLAGSVKE